MLVELKETELREISGGCQSCYEAGVRVRGALEVAWVILMFI